MTLESSPPLASGLCPLCGAATTGSDERCAACGFALAGVDGRAPVFSRRALWWSISVFAVVYLATLAIVALTR